METKIKGYKNVYPKGIPKDQYSVIDSSMRTDRVKDTNVSIEVGDKIGNSKVVVKVSYLEVIMVTDKGNNFTTTIPVLLDHITKVKEKE